MATTRENKGKQASRLTTPNHRLVTAISRHAGEATFVRVALFALGTLAKRPGCRKELRRQNATAAIEEALRDEAPDKVVQEHFRRLVSKVSK